MTNEDVEKKLGVFETLLNKVVAFVKPKNLMLQDTNGMQIDFGPDIQDPAQIVVGISATVDGQPADGEYTLPDGSVLVFAAGTLNEIRPPASSELEALKTENELLKADLATKQSEFETFKKSAEEQITTVQREFKAFRAQFSKGDEHSYAGTDDEDSKKPTIRRAFKTSKN